eukprot:3937740-Rhodomonas_salina.1
MTDPIRFPQSEKSDSSPSLSTKQSEQTDRSRNSVRVCRVSRHGKAGQRSIGKDSWAISIQSRYGQIADSPVHEGGSRSNA